MSEEMIQKSKRAHQSFLILMKRIIPETAKEYAMVSNVLGFFEEIPKLSSAINGNNGALSKIEQDFKEMSESFEQERISLKAKVTELREQVKVTTERVKTKQREIDILQSKIDEKIKSEFDSNLENDLGFEDFEDIDISDD
jgi:predicted  nucleic acid-binding Zn-ribbon protein